MTDREQRPQFVEWVGGRDGRRMKWGDFEYVEQTTHNGVLSKEFVFQRVSGDWPDDADLITLADGDAPAHKSHFGGVVRGSGESRTILVYID